MNARHLHTWQRYDAAPGLFQVICRDCGRIWTADDLVRQQDEVFDLRDELEAERARHARTQAHLDDFQGHAAAASVELLKIGRPEVRAFARLMETQLRANDHKGAAGWKDHAPHLLIARVFDELAEAIDTIESDHDTLAPEQFVAIRLLQTAAMGLRRFGPFLRCTGDAKTGGEIADVANMLMMVADVLGCLSPIEEKETP